MIYSKKARGIYRFILIILVAIMTIGFVYGYINKTTENVVIVKKNLLSGKNMQSYTVKDKNNKEFTIYIQNHKVPKTFLLWGKLKTNESYYIEYYNFMFRNIVSDIRE